MVEAGILATASGLDPREISFQIERGEPCPGLNTMRIDFIRYRETQRQVLIGAMIPLPLVPGQQATISLPIEKLVVEPGPFPILMMNEKLGVMAPVGEAVASNGVITLTISGSSRPTGWDGNIELIQPEMSTAACERGEIGYQGVGELLVSLVWARSTLGTFRVCCVLCNTAPPSTSGELPADENGRSDILWTIDSGEIFDGATVTDGLASYYRESNPFDCGSRNVTPAYERRCPESG